MDKNEREKNFLNKWSMENGAQYFFSAVEKEKKSYFIKREKGPQDCSYIREYGFETLPELTGELDGLWENDEVLKKTIKVVGIAAIKNKPLRKIEDRVEDKKDTGEKLPVYIYNF